MTEIWHFFNQRPDNGRWVLIYSRATKTPSVIKMAECITFGPDCVWAYLQDILYAGGVEI